MQHSQDAGHIDPPVQGFPSFAQPAHRRARRRQRQRQQDQECRQANERITLGEQRLDNELWIEQVIQPEKDRQVQGDVQKSVKTEQAAQRNNLPPAKPDVRRRDRQRQHEQNDRRLSCTQRDLADWVRTQVSLRVIPYDERQGDERSDVHGEFEQAL